MFFTILAGGFAFVFVAADNSGREYALKVIFSYFKLCIMVVLVLAPEKVPMTLYFRPSGGEIIFK